MSTQSWNLKGPIKGKYGPFYVYNDVGLEKGITVSQSQVLNAHSSSITEALTQAGLDKIGYTPNTTSSLMHGEGDNTTMTRIADALESIASSLTELVKLQ